MNCTGSFSAIEGLRFPEEAVIVKLREGRLRLGLGSTAGAGLQDCTQGLLPFSDASINRPTTGETDWIPLA